MANDLTSPYVQSLAGRGSRYPERMRNEEIVIGCAFAKARAEDRKFSPGVVLTGEFTSDRVALIADRGLLDPESLIRDEVQQVFTSLLTQSADKGVRMGRMLASDTIAAGTPRNALEGPPPGAHQLYR